MSFGSVRMSDEPPVLLPSASLVELWCGSRQFRLTSVNRKWAYAGPTSRTTTQATFLFFFLEEDSKLKLKDRSEIQTAECSSRFWSYETQRFVVLESTDFNVMIEVEYAFSSTLSLTFPPWVRRQ
jgi:hypothetical protein